MIVLAFKGVLSCEARERIAADFKRAEQEAKVLVVEDCYVLCDGPTEQTPVEFSDGSVMFVPKGLSKQAVLDAVQLLIDKDQDSA